MELDIRSVDLAPDGVPDDPADPDFGSSTIREAVRR